MSSESPKGWARKIALQDFSLLSWSPSSPPGSALGAEDGALSPRMKTSPSCEGVGEGRGRGEIARRKGGAGHLRGGRVPGEPTREGHMEGMAWGLQLPQPVGREVKFVQTLEGGRAAACPCGTCVHRRPPHEGRPAPAAESGAPSRARAAFLHHGALPSQKRPGVSRSLLGSLHRTAHPS